MQRVASRPGEPSIGIMAGNEHSVVCGLRCCARGRAGASAPAADAAKKRTIARELERGCTPAGAIDQATYDADRAIYDDVKRRIKRLTGTRKAQLAGVLATVKGIAARGQMRASRLSPLFLTLQRNAEWWASEPLLATGQRVTFPGSELVWQYVPGQGLQLHPLANFGKLNAYAKVRAQQRAQHAAARRADGDRRAARRRARVGVLLHVRRRRAAVGQRPGAGHRAAGDRPLARPSSAAWRSCCRSIQQGLKLFEQAPPTGVRVRDAGAGIQYAQYSFWPEPAHPQRLRPVARRPLRRRADHRRPARRAAVRRRRRDGAPRCRRSTPARGRCTRAARSRASPTSATTRCCATSSPACASARRRPVTATPRRTSPSTSRCRRCSRSRRRALRGGTAGKLEVLAVEDLAHVGQRHRAGRRERARRSPPARSGAGRAPSPGRPAQGRHLHGAGRRDRPGRQRREHRGTGRGAQAAKKAQK